MRQPGLAVLELFVASLERSAAFYGAVVGMPLSMDDDGPDPPHLEAWWPDTADRDYLYLAFWAEADPARRTRLSLGFVVDDLDAMHRRAVAAAVEVVGPPQDGEYGRRAEYVDPDGNRVTVGQRNSSSSSG